MKYYITELLKMHEEACYKGSSRGYTLEQIRGALERWRVAVEENRVNREVNSGRKEFNCEEKR